ncbi:hypothetical protein FisN_36Hh021 [Fistulifera solaris]|jgi:hypothetical protein|uniref:Uncharacterized protein n=1 Tax=Fistulifera solaris TaxID=1519565 RepID=A0A1Z5KTL3_FISSO|nr:hypothetical protein FisN_36Hh021 [Fistulifera solaris]|eukprot:GAX29527.1 hypothetical protein FisN_36Hh021 [Fistulifera solaris]
MKYHHILYATLLFRRLCGAFIIPAESRSRTCLISAVKKSTNNLEGGKSGGGFGSTKSSPNNKKLRSISSKHTGSGSKVLRKAANTFDAIRKEHGKNACNDVYIRSPLNSPTTFWFVGKIAAKPGIVPTHACLAQKRVIFEYSQRELRPQNMGGSYASALELWYAPGDSEMDVVRNQVNLTKVEGSAADLPDDFDANLVGYNPEIYVGEERTEGGLRVEKSEEGKSIKPVFEVNEAV